MNAIAAPAAAPAAARRGRGGPIVPLALVAMLLALASARAEENAAMESAPIAPIAYSVEIRGVEDSGIRSTLEQSSQLIALSDHPPASDAGLVRRVDDDIERFRQVLRSEGYYDSLITPEIDWPQSASEKPKVKFSIDIGPQYTLERYDIVFVAAPRAEPGAADAAASAAVKPEPATADGAVSEADAGTPAPLSDLAEAAPAPADEAPLPPPEGPLPALPSLADLGLRLGGPARSATILAAEPRLLDRLADEGYPLARIVDRKAVVDHRTQTMRVEVRVAPGPFARFGTVSIEGLTSVREDYIRMLVPWHEGDPWDGRKVDALRRKLAETGLFASILIEPAAALAPDGTLPVTLRFVEGTQRSIGVGAKYYTSEGIATELFWEHRNLFGRNEDLRITLEVGTIRQKARVDFTRPDYRRVGQDLILSAEARRQDTHAFKEVAVESSARIRRPLSETWTGTLGTSLEWSRQHDEDGTRTATLLGLPGELAWDDTDSKLDPRKGARLRLEATPYTGWSDQSITFLVSRVGVTGYQPLDEEKRYVLATRARVGSITGESRQDIPPNKRFYAGGGDSIRGYQFQKVGPLEDNNDPIGGRSLLEVSAEFRARVWGNFGVVPFIDGGTVYESSVPDGSEQFRWGAGLGLRYYTLLGPVRFDVAFPLNPRNDVDDSFQFYIGLGQAF